MIALNLLGSEPAAPAARQRATFWLAPMALVAAFALVHTWQSRDLSRLALDVARLKSQTAQLGRDVDEARRRARTHNELAARFGLLEKLGRERGRAHRVLIQVANSLSPRTWLTELSYSGDSVSISGISPGPDEVTELLHRLHGLAIFADVDTIDIDHSSAEASPAPDHCKFKVKGHLQAASSFALTPHSLGLAKGAT